MIPFHKKLLWFVEGLLIFITVIAIIVFTFNCIENSFSNREFNNGVCAKCGGNYIYQQAVGHFTGTYYIYECDKCGNHIEIPKYMRK